MACLRADPTGVLRTLISAQTSTCGTFGEVRRHKAANAREEAAGRGEGLTPVGVEGVGGAALVRAFGDEAGR